MALDPSIILGYRAPVFESPLQQYGNVMAIQNAGNQNRLADLQYRQALKAEAEGNELKSALRNAGGDETQIVNALLRSGRVKEAQDFQKAGLERKKLTGEITAQDIKAAQARMEALSGLIAPLAMKPDLTHEDIFAAGRQAQTMGLIPEGWAREVPMNAMQLPAYVRQLALATEQGRKSLEMLQPKVTMADTNSQLIPTNTNPLAGAIGPLAGASPINKTVSPSDLMTDERVRSEGNLNRALQASEGAANRGVTMRGQNMTEARAGQTYDAERGVVVDTRNGVARPVTTGGQPIGQKLSEHAKKEIQGIDAQANTVRQAIKSVEQTPDAFGIVRGAATMAGTLPETIANAASNDANIQARSTVFNIVSKVINERAGAAQSAQELARLRSFLPSEMDNASVIKSKLEGFEKYLKEQRKAYESPVQTKSGGASGGWSIEVVK